MEHSWRGFGLTANEMHAIPIPEFAGKAGLCLRVLTVEQT